MRVTCRDVTGLRARSSPGTSRSALLSPGTAGHTLKWLLAESVLLTSWVPFAGLRVPVPALPGRLPTAKPALAAACPRLQSPACRVCPEFAEHLSCPRSLCLPRAYFQSLGLLSVPRSPCARAWLRDCRGDSACAACPVHRACLGSLSGTRLSA